MEVDTKAKEAIVEQLPPEIKALSKGISGKLEDVLAGEQYKSLRASLKERGIAEYKGTTIAADFDKAGNVMAMAAAVSRTPTNSEQWLKDNVPDFSISGTSNTTDFSQRKQRIALFYKIASQEGIVNNAIKKTASIIAQEGSFKVRSAKQGKRPVQTVSDELLRLLVYWQENVNSADLNQAVTGSRGIIQIIRRGSRQAMIEGDLFLRQVWEKTKIPSLANQTYSLPLMLQAMPAASIYVPIEIIGTGSEVYYWKPDPSIIQAFNSSDPNVRKIMERNVPSKIRTQLKKDGQILLDASLLTHIKHGGTDIDVFGKSMVEPCLTDLAYARSLKMLDFVTVDSLVNRMLIIKIGDPNKESDYHNLAVAQARVNVFRKLLTGSVGPNMMIVWAGHDIEKLDVSAHDSLLDTDERHKLAQGGLKASLGVPDSVLTGSVEGGARGTGWLGFMALNTVVEELRDEFGQVLTQLGRRIAIENKFNDIDLVWEFNKTLLADKEANAKIMIQAYDRGLLSKESILEELDKDYEAEKVRKQEGLDAGDDALFAPPLLPTGGPGGNQGIAPKAPPGRPATTGNPAVLPPKNPPTAPTKPPKGT